MTFRSQSLANLRTPAAGKSVALSFSRILQNYRRAFASKRVGQTGFVARLTAQAEEGGQNTQGNEEPRAVVLE
jgi:hypothetical protein